MNKLHLWAENIRRSFAFPFPIKALGYESVSRISPRQTIHPTIDFCLLLSDKAGNIERICGQSRSAAHFPCLNINIPGLAYVNLSDSTVNNIFFAYDAALLPAFRKIFPDLDTPCREFVMTPSISALVKHIHQLAVNGHELGAIDRIDACCYELIVEIMLSSRSKEKPDAPDMIVRQIASLLESNFTEPASWAMYLKARGISYRSFIRYWRKAYRTSPTQFVNTLRVREAQRMLTNTDLSVKAIARQVGMHDAYYFSRIFKKIIGIAPGHYRYRDGKDGNRRGRRDQ